VHSDVYFGLGGFLFVVYHMINFLTFLAIVCFSVSDLLKVLNFQNTFDRACDEIRMEIQTENFFGSNKD
jgi:hypothetical protein